MAKQVGGGGGGGGAVGCRVNGERGPVLARLPPLASQESGGRSLMHWQASPLSPVSLPPAISRSGVLAGRNHPPSEFSSRIVHPGWIECMQDLPTNAGSSVAGLNAGSREL